MRDKIVRSRYFILINSNTSVLNQTPQAQKKLKDFMIGIKKILLTKNILNFIKILDQDDFDVPKEDLINSITSEGVFEVGTQNHYLHLHLDIAIDHRTTLMIVTNRITKYFNYIFNLSVFVPKGRLISDNSVSVKGYSFKTVRRFKCMIKSVIVNIDGKTESFNYTFK